MIHFNITPFIIIIIIIIIIVGIGKRALFEPQPSLEDSARLVYSVMN
jgi:hypothetical protein